MRYMQMIKRCTKLPLKKATQDVEAHSEEQAKRCTLSSGDVRTTCPSWEDRLGHLHQSAIARLLVEGKLPADTITSGPLNDSGSSAMDLSKSSSVLDKARNFHRDDYRMKTESVDLIEATADRIRHQMGVEMEALKTRSSSNEVRFGGWKCRYCPYTANTSKKLYSHYQFHQQLLTSHSSKPHMEWLAAYRQAKEFSDGHSSPAITPVTSSTHMTSPTTGEHLSSNGSSQTTPFQGSSFPVGLGDPERFQAMRANGLSLRYLLGGKGHLAKQASVEQNSASGCLRSIVQAVMQQGTHSKGSVTATSVYASLVNGSLNGVDSDTSSPNSVTVSEMGAAIATSQTVLPKEEGQLQNGHTGNSVVLKPKPRRAEAPIDLQQTSRQGSPFLNSPLESSVHPQVVEQPHLQINGECEKQLAEYNSPLRQTVTVECQMQMPLPTPPRPTSRGSTSSYTSSASSEEINVDDSPPSSYDRSRIDSMASDYSDNAFVSRVASRKRTRSAESDTASLSSFHQHHQPQSNTYTCQDIVCRTEELERNTNAKVPCLDYSYSSQIKAESAHLADTACLRHSPMAVISSTGTPPPIDTMADKRDKTPIDVTNLTTQDNSVQCELLVPPSGDQWRNLQLLGPEAAVMSVPDQSTNQDGGFFQRANESPAMIGSVKCPHCGIMFDDSVLHSIHMGCHSHCDPFICNVCGEQCSNKYGFYTHIMRGHHKH